MSRDRSTAEHGSELRHVDPRDLDIGTDSADPPAQQYTALAIEVHQGKLGCVVFSEDEHELFIGEDQPFDLDTIAAESIERSQANEAPSLPSQSHARMQTEQQPSSDLYNLLDSLLLQFHPDLVVASTRCAAPVLSALRKYVDIHTADLQIRSAKDFQLNFGLQALSQTILASNNAGREGFESDQNGLPDAVALDAIASVPKSALSLSAVGPLVACLRNCREVGQILSVTSLSLNNDAHAFVHADGGREGFSMLAMLQLTSSKFSNTLLKRWIMFPLADRGLIEQRHDAVELLARQESSTEIVELRQRIVTLSKVSQLCYLLNMGVGSVYTWERLFKTCAAVQRIKSLLHHMDLGSSQLLTQLRDRLTVDSLARLHDNIAHTLDWEESKNDGKITVKPGVDQHLDTLRANHAGLPDLLDRVAQEIRSEPAFSATQQVHVVYFPQIGYLIVVPGGEIVDMAADESLEQQFSSESNVYLKSSRMVDMDQHLGDLASFIVDREIEVLDGIQNNLVECCPQLIEAHKVIMELDCLLAFSRASLIYGLQRPKLSEDPILRLKGCRHPLKALSDDNFVPNDIELWAGYGAPTNEKEITEDTDTKKSVMVLTGANSSGKSCLLQSAALAVFMSQCGCFVPAVDAELGIFDKILTRIRQDESVASEGSSFTRELGRLSRALTCSTRKSLVLLDEVGRECRSDDGAGLFIAAVHDFLDRGRDCPIVLSATHHLRAITAHLGPPLRIYRAHMQTVFVPETDSASTLTYLYRLCPEFAGSPHASHCALLCGVPNVVVNRAVEITAQGIKAWQDSQAAIDEQVSRRLLGVDFDQLLLETDAVAEQELLEWIVFGQNADTRSASDEDAQAEILMFSSER